MPITTQSATLLLAIHGSSDDDRPAQMGNALAEGLRARREFLEVKVGFHKHAPHLDEALREAQGDPVIILPMLMTSGYFAENLFPKSLQLPIPTIQSYPTMMESGERHIIYCEPIGMHPEMSGIVRHSAETILATHPFPLKTSLEKCAIALVGHGTPRHPHSKKSVEAIVQTLNTTPGLCRGARGFYIEEAPFVREILDWESPSQQVVVIPFMIADGPHANQDIPAALGQSKRDIERRQEKGRATWQNPTQRGDKRIWISPPVGLSPLIPDLILSQVRKLDLLMD